MNILIGIIGAAFLIALVAIAASCQREENDRLEKRFYNEYEDLK